MTLMRSYVRKCVLEKCICEDEDRYQARNVKEVHSESSK